MQPSATDGSAARPELPAPPRAVWPFQHARLVAFFVLLVLAGTAFGIWRLRRLGPAPAPVAVERTLALAVCGTALAGLAGVFVHRLRVLPLRFQETERYLAAIERESHKYRLLMEGAADMLVLVDPDSGRLREWNARARGALDLDGGATPGLERLAAGEHLERLRAAVLQASDAGGGVATLDDVELCAADGGTLAADVRLASIPLADERSVLLALRDVTRQKEIEAELALRERLSSLGLLTAGVAHEINNPLAGIANYLRLAARPDLAPEARAEHLEGVRHGFERIRDLVRELLRFARPQAGEGETDLAESVRRAMRLAAYSPDLAGVTLESEGLEAPLPVTGDAGRLEQVFFNLLLNAGAIMGGAGRVRVRAQREGERAVEVAVEDEGPGIAPEHLERIFDPFFSTRGSTGLGLSVSYGIVRAHGGELRASNLPGGGASFRVHLPLRGAR
ncbi:MAG TPA: ATP-binding protein [Planctomycetota bacterium]|nr:ATP-binding protein [Planctomycetota bacterium]